MDLAAAGLRLLLRQAALRPLATGPARRSAIISWPASTTRTSSRAFSKITTSRGPPPNLLGRSIRRRRSSRFCRRACAFSIRASSRASELGCRPICAAVPAEPANPEIRGFYDRLLRVLKETGAFRDGGWSQIEPQPAWPGNWTSDCFVAFAWAGEDRSNHVVVVNYAANQAQCRLPLPFPELRGSQSA